MIAFTPFNLLFTIAVAAQTVKAVQCGVGAEGDGLCPLKVCCSRWGFCGITPEFCGSGCQSNCKQPVPSGPRGDVQNLVIGYYQSWVADGKTCSKVLPKDLPIASLTHVYFSFAFIQPKTYEVITTPGMNEVRFSEVTNLKDQAPGLKIVRITDNYIALGGWTFNDDHTPWQAVFSDLCSTKEKRAKFINNLLKFMQMWGFDGVDFDWEYPGAPDRGGHKNDGVNYAALMAELRQEIDSRGLDLGISFTAPSSFWYLKWFDLKGMMQHVDWVNLMSYDIHGEWDRTSGIGNRVFPHTGLVEINDALNLFWRNDVPPNKVNLGLAFYGRSYKLQDPTCYRPGCMFVADAKQRPTAGECTRSPGILSYKEIMNIQQSRNIVPYKDDSAEVKYMNWDKDQWVSFDDADTFKEKIEFANKLGLLGVFIWAIDQDDDNHSALRGVLDPVPLGKFSEQNGIGIAKPSGWTDISGHQCHYSACGSGCDPAYNTLSTVSCGSENGKRIRRSICCPLTRSPDPAKCRWDIGNSPLVIFGCNGECAGDEMSAVGSSRDAVIAGEDVHCWTGSASLCCKQPEANRQCRITKSCYKRAAWENNEVNPCTEFGNEFDWEHKTFIRGICNEDEVIENDGASNALQPSIMGQHICCKKSANIKNCRWQSKCADGQLQLAADNSIESEAKQKSRLSKIIDQLGSWSFGPLAKHYCCDPSKGSIKQDFPVPLDRLFKNPPPKENIETINLQVDETMGGQIPANPPDKDPNINAFGLVIVSAPPDKMLSLDKRDGSKWNVLNCKDSKNTAPQTINLVCEDKDQSKCPSPADKIIELPEGCGAGRYAMARKFELSEKEEPARIMNPPTKGSENRPVYDLEYHYDFSSIQKRGNQEIYIRIDYSNQPGYWDHIVSELGEHNGDEIKKRQMRKRDLDQLDGNHRRWLEEKYREDRNNLSKEDLHALWFKKEDTRNLHRRWFSDDSSKWYERQKQVDDGYNKAHHRVNERSDWYLVDQTRQCKAKDVGSTLARAKVWADLAIDIETSIGVTIIGHLDDLENAEAHAYFRNQGSVTATLNVDALGSVSFIPGQKEMFGNMNFGGTFSVPGIVTIGPNMRVLGEMEGQMDLEASTQFTVQLSSWNYEQHYPQLLPDSAPIELHAPDKPQFSMTNTDPFKWNIIPKGQITASFTPVVSLDIDFVLSKRAGAKIDLGVNTWLRLSSQSQLGNKVDAEICAGINGGLEVFGAITAPKLFGGDLKQRWPVWKREYDISGRQCMPKGNLVKRSLQMSPQTLLNSNETVEDGNVRQFNESVRNSREPIQPSLQKRSLLSMRGDHAAFGPAINYGCLTCPNARVTTVKGMCNLMADEGSLGEPEDFDLDEMESGDTKFAPDGKTLDPSRHNVFTLAHCTVQHPFSENKKLPVKFSKLPSPGSQKVADSKDEGFLLREYLDRNIAGEGCASWDLVRSAKKQVWAEESSAGPITRTNKYHADHALDRDLMKLFLDDITKNPQGEITKEEACPSVLAYYEINHNEDVTDSFMMTKIMNNYPHEGLPIPTWRTELMLLEAKLAFLKESLVHEYALGKLDFTKQPVDNGASEAEKLRRIALLWQYLKTPELNEAFIRQYKRIHDAMQERDTEMANLKIHNFAERWKEFILRKIDAWEAESEKYVAYAMEHIEKRLKMVGQTVYDEDSYVHDAVKQRKSGHLRAEAMQWPNKDNL